MFSEKNNSLIKWVLMIILSLIWGSSYILMKRGLESFPYMQVGAIRLTISFLLLLPFAIARLKKVKKEKLIYIAIAGLLGNGIPAYLFALAQTGIDSQIAGILNSVAPLFTLIIGVIFFRFHTKWFNITGVLIGLSGAIGLLSVCGNKSFDFNFSFGIYVIFATLLYSININIVKRYLKDTDSITITSFAFIFIGVPSLIYLLSGTDFLYRLSETPQALKGLGYISVLALFGTAIAGILYNYLIKISTIIYAASITYLIPVIAVIWGIADGEKFGLSYIFWILLIFTGVFLVNKSTFENRNKA